MSFEEILAYWDTLPEKIQILIICFIAVTSIVEMIRRGFLIDIDDKRQKRRYIYATALSVGASVGISGFFLTDGQPNWFWAFVASTGGGVSVVMHHVIIKILWPKALSFAPSNKNGKVVSKDQVMKMPKPEGKPDAPTEYYIKDDQSD
jgi:hypothetical protein